jgi:hypothetical protein
VKELRRVLPLFTLAVVVLWLGWAGFIGPPPNAVTKESREAEGPIILRHLVGLQHAYKDSAQTFGMHLAALDSALIPRFGEVYGYRYRVTRADTSHLCIDADPVATFRGDSLLGWSMDQDTNLFRRPRCSGIPEDWPAR